MVRNANGSVAWPIAALLLLGVYGAGVASVWFSPAQSAVALWAPAAGLAVAVLTLSRVRRWAPLAFGVVVATAAANVTGGLDLDAATWFGVCNAAGAVAAAAILRRGSVEIPRLDNPEALARLVVAAAVGATVAGLGTATVVTYLDDGTVWRVLRTVLPSHAAATLVLVPAVLSVDGSRWRWRSPHLLIQTIALVATLAMIFAPDQQLAVAFALFPVLAWGALSFDLRTVTWQLALIGVVSSYLTARGWGPFAPTVGGGGRQLAGAMTQGFILAAALTALPLAVARAQRRVLLARISADERLFRRNFTESLTGMLFVRGVTPEPYDPRAGKRVDLSVIDVNETAATILGQPRTELVGSELDALLDVPEDLGRVAARVLDGIDTGWNSQVSLAGAREGRVIVGLSLLSPGPGEAIFAVQLIDVTAEYEARRASEAAEQLTSATLNTAACLILLTDLEGRIVRANAATTQITGYPEQELVGRVVWETPLAPRAAVEMEAMLLWPSRTPAPVSHEADAITRTGETRRIAWNHNLVRGEGGTPTYAVLTGTDVTSERQASGLVDHLLRASISTALVGVDHSGRITVFNSGAAHLLGFREEEMIGHPFHDLLDDDELRSRTGVIDLDDAFERLVRGVGNGRDSEARDWTWRDRAGTPHIVSMTISAADDPLAAENGFLVVGRDVTSHRRGEEMLVAALEKERSAVERLRALDAAKDEFVSTVSHELRTPVTSILGYTELLRDGAVVEPPEAQLPLLATITRNSHRLIEVCNDLLALSELNEGTHQWAQDPVDLGACLDNVDDAIRPLVADRKLDLELSRPPLPVMVRGDQAQLERVMVNLLSNAVKFTEDGGAVSCALTVDASVGEAVLTVRDTGMGIPVDEQDGLFQKFFRTSTAQERAIQGTGLGLSIVAAVVEGHGGRISVDSEAGKGATFTVRLPLLP